MEIPASYSEACERRRKKLGGQNLFENLTLLPRVFYLILPFFLYICFGIPLGLYKAVNVQENDCRQFI
jgi:hypothetical protein